MNFELVVVQGRSASSVIKLADGVTTIGRNDDCQVRIKSSQVSRRHCELFEKKGLLLVKDLNSSNGTLVNGKRIQGQRVLEPGDELTIGPILLRISKLGSGAAAVAKPASKAGDTAVSEAIPIEAPDADDFTIEFEDSSGDTQAAAAAPATTAPARPASQAKAKAAQTHEDDIADYLIDLPMGGDEEDSDAPTAVQATIATPSGPPPQAEKPAAKKEEKPAEPAPEPEPAAPPAGAKEEPKVSDDAIADFLLDIKLDDEE